MKVINILGISITTEELIDQTKPKENWVFKFKIKIKNSMNNEPEKPLIPAKKLYCHRKRKNHCAKALIDNSIDLPICTSIGRCIYQLKDLKNNHAGDYPGNDVKDKS